MSRGDSVLRTNVTKLKRALFLLNINIELLVFFSSLILKLFEPNRRTKETEAEKWAGLSYEIMNWLHSLSIAFEIEFYKYLHSNE